MYNFQPHLKVIKAVISPYVLLPGDPGRVGLIGKFLENFKIVADNREFKIGVGKYQNKQITVCSTGIGCPSMAIAAEELINAGAKYLIRVGTCGGAWRKDIPIGSLIIPNACVRDEGLTLEYIPQGFPAVGDLETVMALVASAQKLNQKYFVGVNRTHDAFYGEQSSITKWGKYLLDKKWKNYDTPILSSDMECAALYVVASLRGVKAGCVLAVNAGPESLRDRLVGKKQKIVAEKEKNISKKIIEKSIVVALESFGSLKI